MLIQCQRIRSNAKIPERATDGAVGYDVFASAVLDKGSKEVIGHFPASIGPGESILIGTGIRFAVPFKMEAQVRPRSGLANKYDIELSNSPGTIDPDFRGESGVLLRNRGSKEFVIEEGMRVAQLIFTHVELPVLQDVEELSPTVRGAGGFGSTGLLEIAGGTSRSDTQQERLDRYFMGITFATAELSDCIRGVTPESPERKRKFGCIIVKNGNIIASGYNAFYPGQKECLGVCIRDLQKIRSGSHIEEGGCNHAEWMSISKLGLVGSASAEDSTVYVNAEPCIVCARLLAMIKPETVVVPAGVYPSNGTGILRDAGIVVRYL